MIIRVVDQPPSTAPERSMRRQIDVPSAQPGPTGPDGPHAHLYLETGHAMTPPAKAPMNVYEVRVVDDRIEIAR
ncbi:hypothetical protein [Sphingobium yanoikuyae]|uniref:hypothetical protein n=1 Tax=Sphingobium yanoikuyae TaxID=13690 RepID=UPI0035B17917